MRTSRFPKALLAALALMASGALTLRAQSDLSIVDQLPPYRLSATLLANGHFSISTRYTGTDRMVVYQEDGSGNKPVNYTSHVHFKVDDVIFQLPFELNPATRQSPPDHPLAVTGLFRDTLGGMPRVNARMHGVMPDGDTIRFIFSMMPVKRPSGGFIRLSAEVENSTRRERSVGVLMLVDTKIGDNDRAPIISSFGYKTVETEFDRALAPGMPEFWLGLEGTPIDPMLTTRGNLRAPGLIEPDYFLFGNWKDNTALPGAFGMDLAQWKERRAFNVGYTDSAILLLWGEEMMAAGERRLRASTEIGIVDSIDVDFASGGFGGIGFGGAGGGGGTGGCLGFDTLVERSCGDPTYHPYLPDSLQSLYLVTNTGAKQIANARVAFPSLPAGLRSDVAQGGVIPSTLDPSITGVATITLHARPRLTSKSYSVPVSLVAGVADTLIHDTLCVAVPGLLGALDADSLGFLPLCPGLDDTMSLRVRLRGPRCLDLTPRPVLIGPARSLARFSLIDPIPTRIPANGEVELRVRYVAGAPGEIDRVKVVVMATDRGLNDDDRDTTVIVSDTADVEAVTRDAEFFFAGPTDTLDLGAVCIGDTSTGDWLVTNIGGCDLVIERSYLFENDPLAQFSVANDAGFPLTVARGSDERVLLRFAPVQAGTATARFIIRSSAAPFVDTLIVRGRGDAPTFTLAPSSGGPDTICPGERLALSVPITNPTACPITIDGVAVGDTLFKVDSAGFVLPPRSTRAIIVTSRIEDVGSYATELRVRSSGGLEESITIGAVVASRELALTSTGAFGDVRLGSMGGPERMTIRSTGTAEVVITTVRIGGGSAAEYAYTLPNGERFPLHLAPGGTLDLDLSFTPRDLGDRRAALIIETAPRTLCTPVAPLDLTGRGVMPVIDAPRRRLQLGRLCAGSSFDTTIILRNLGNAPLTVNEVVVESIAGSAHVEATGLPVVIEPDSAIRVSVKLAPESLGAIDMALHFVSDGAWFTAPDTTVRLGATGVICGTIWADTVRALIGDRVAIPIHFDPSPLSIAEAVRLMNGSNARGVGLALEGERSLVRFDGMMPGMGMLAGATTPPVVTVNGSAIRVVSDGDAGDLAASDIIAALTADLLLGTRDRSTLKLSVESFAGGNADIIVRDGLLIAEYCALDRRYVELRGPLLRPAGTPLNGSGAFTMHLPEDSHATLTLYDALGRAVARLYDADAAAGTYHIPIAPHEVAAGSYTAVLMTSHGVTSARVVIVE